MTQSCRAIEQGIGGRKKNGGCPHFFQLYRAFSQSGSSLTWEIVETIETQALIRGGMNAEQAAATVQNAIQALKDAGVSGPTRIPWRG